ncbi:MAG: trypsin-like peptidase domain-containing protein [Thermodesulfobacteriota bacterium]
MKLMAYRIALIFAGVVLLSGLAGAEIYQYKDADGKWHFTDTPSDETAESAEPLTGAARQTSGGRNLEKRLQARCRPSNPVERTAMATVTIKSSIGSGSGFFISSRGHILTNRHVIRGSRKRLEYTDKALDKIDERIESVEKQFKRKKQQLEKFKSHLDHYKASISRMPEGAAREREMQRYAIERRRYESRKADYQRKKARYEDKRSDYENKKSAYRYKTTTAALSRNFTVTLKDGSEYSAYLVADNQDHDLALLKISGSRTPRIAPADMGLVAQGDRVYAIGSPAGLRDSVSKGIFSGFESNFIETDAKIYPGNSGGPLVTSDGRVLGINSFKKLTRKFEGLGFAIPIDVAMDAFGSHIRP